MLSAMQVKMQVYDSLDVACIARLVRATKADSIRTVFEVMRRHPQRVRMQRVGCGAYAFCVDGAMEATRACARAGEWMCSVDGPRRKRRKKQSKKLAAKCLIFSLREHGHPKHRCWTLLNVACDSYAGASYGGKM